MHTLIKYLGEMAKYNIMDFIYKHIKFREKMLLFGNLEFLRK